MKFWSRRTALVLAAILFVSLFPSIAPAQSGLAKPTTKPLDGPTLVVFDIVPEKGVEKGEANLLTELVIDKVARTKKYNVIGQKDIDKLMDWEQNKQLKGCTDSSCLIQIAGAMGSSFFIEGSIGVMGDNYMINLKLMDTRSVRIVERRTEIVKKDENVLVAAMLRIVDAVIGVSTPESRDKPRAATPALVPVVPAPPVEKKVEAPPVVPLAVAIPIPVPANPPPPAIPPTSNVAAEKKPEPAAGLEVQERAVAGEVTNPYSTWGKAGTLTGLGVVAAGGLFAVLSKKSADDYKKGSSSQSMQDSLDKMDLYNVLSIVGLALGGSMAVTGVTLWIYGETSGSSAGDTSPAHSVVLAPCATPHGGSLSVVGGW